MILSTKVTIYAKSVPPTGFIDTSSGSGMHCVFHTRWGMSTIQYPAQVHAYPESIQTRTRSKFCQHRPLIWCSSDPLWYAPCRLVTYCVSDGIFNLQCYFERNFIEIYSQRSSQKFLCIDSCYDLAPNGLQAIIWSNHGLVRWLIYPLILLDVLIQQGSVTWH